MADLSAPSKIKQLFSSFLSNVIGDNNIKRNEKVNSSNGHNETAVDDTVKTGTVDTISSEPPNSSRGTLDSRNKTEFYQRVATYSPVTWCAKPLFLSPLECARYGWENVDIDMLQCNHCRAFLCGQLPKAVETLAYKESCKKLKQNLKESHENTCKWSSNPSPESFTHIQYHDRKALNTDFYQRVISLSGIEDRLPEVSYSSFEESTEGAPQTITREDLDGIVSQVSEYLKRLDITCSEKVIIYSMSGWSYNESQKDVEVLQCNFCCRKVGLWNYKATGSKLNTLHNDEPTPKKPKLEKTSFDPIAGHRYWCPWLRAQTPPTFSNDQSSLSPASSPIKSYSIVETDVSPTKHSTNPAWICVAKLLSRYNPEGCEMEDFLKQMKQSPQIEGVRHIRKILHDCTSPPSQRRTILNIPSSSKTP